MNPARAHDSPSVPPSLIAAMLRPDFYDNHPDRVTVKQTHISVVFLAGDEVFKVKKPVRFTFLDFSTLDQRRHFCREEVRLNRRLAPDTYVGVVAICRSQGGYRIGPEDDPAAVEFAVHMRRLPDERILSYLLANGHVPAHMIDAIAARLAAFHRAADPDESVTANGAPAAIAAVLDDNFRGMRPFRNVTVAAPDDNAIQEFSTRFLRDHDALFRRRQTEHRIRDGHGDLHCEHICLTDPIAIFDCVEFSHRFRYCDVASEIAFLAMDLDYRGHPALAKRLVKSYAAAAADPDLERLVPFYQCYRAYVRGKVDSLKSADPQVDAAERDAASDSARRHFAHAYRYTWTYTPCLVLVVGLSGTGKSTLAAALAARTGFAHVNSDVVRKQIRGLSPTTRPTAATDLYSAEHSERTYAAMFAAAEGYLAAGQGVILDATFQRCSGRDECRRIAAAADKPIVLVECRSDPRTVQQRLADRVADNSGPSDADWSVYLEQRRRAEPLLPDERALTIDTDSRPTDDAVRAIEREMRHQCEAAKTQNPAPGRD